MPRLAIGMDDETLLRTVVSRYTSAFTAGSPAHSYLARRGIDSLEIAARFGLGYSNRTLAYHLPGGNRKEARAVRERLRALGILRGSGHEHFSGCVVVPLYSTQGDVLQCYARRLNDGGGNAHTRHLFLPGPLRGVWNREALAGQGELILCQSLTDALTLWAAGFEQVTTTFGPWGLSADLQSALRDRPERRIAIAFGPRHESEAAARLIERQLVAMGIGCRRVRFPAGFDANRYALAHPPASESLAALLSCQPGTVSVPASRPSEEPVRHGGHAMSAPDRVRPSPANGPPHEHAAVGAEGARRRAGLAHLLEVYLLTLRSRAFAESTIRGRALHLGRFVAWCAERRLVSGRKLTLANIEQYQQDLVTGPLGGRPLGITSRVHACSAIRLFLRWAATSRRLPADAAAELVLPRLPRRLPRAVLSAGEADLVLQQPDVATPLGLRDRAMLEVFYSTGIRRMELIHLDLCDVDRFRGFVFVREGKGRKDRLVPIGDRALGWIDRYLMDVRPRAARPGSPPALFLNARGRRITSARLTERMHGYMVSSGVGKPGSCHVWRHTAATLMHERGADIRDLQEMLGHAQLSTTQVYTHVSVERLKAVHTRTHPAR